MADDQPAPARLRNIGFATTWAIAIGFSCIVVGQFAEQFAAIPAADTRTQFAETGPSHPQFNAIDYSQTGAIKGQTLSPCGGRANGQ